MDDLVRWLRAQLDDDEQIAREAHAPNWSTDGRRGLHYGVEDGWMTDALTTADADHIARHDPARVLREIDAKRQLLADFAPLLAQTDATIDGEWNGHDDLHGRLLAYLTLPYADRPGYRDEWRP
jgi:hypothetical protein